MPEIAGVAGGVESRLIVTGTDVVPPALVALHVRSVTPSSAAAVPQPSDRRQRDSASATLQLSVSGAACTSRWHPGRRRRRRRRDDRRRRVERHRDGPVGEHEAGAAVGIGHAGAEGAVERVGRGRHDRGELVDRHRRPGRADQGGDARGGRRGGARAVERPRSAVDVVATSSGAARSGFARTSAGSERRRRPRRSSA